MLVDVRMCIPTKVNTAYWVESVQLFEVPPHTSETHAVKPSPAIAGNEAMVMALRAIPAVTTFKNTFFIFISPIVVYCRKTVACAAIYWERVAAIIA